jgi:hypothetical protein
MLPVGSDLHETVSSERALAKWTPRESAARALPRRWVPRHSTVNRPSVAFGTYPGRTASRRLRRPDQEAASRPVVARTQRRRRTGPAPRACRCGVELGILRPRLTSAGALLFSSRSGGRGQCRPAGSCLGPGRTRGSPAFPIGAGLNSVSTTIAESTTTASLSRCRPRGGCRAPARASAPGHRHDIARTLPRLGFRLLQQPRASPRAFVGPVVECDLARMCAHLNSLPTMPASPNRRSCQFAQISSVLVAASPVYRSGSSTAAA